MDDTRGPGGDAPSQWSRAALRAITHEILTPLTVIRAYSSLVLEENCVLSATEITDLMRQIDASVRLAEVIVGDLEVLAHEEAVRLRLAALDLHRYLTVTLPDLQALAPGRELVLLVADDLSTLADPMRLKQVLQNLVENAHKYSRPGGAICIRAWRLDGAIALAVEDAGPGVPAEELERIFEPFFRGAATSQSRGSGLGLAICRSLVEAQGGCLQAAPTGTGGFRLIVTLPAAPHATGAAAQEYPAA